jgi:hypothetical protein
MEGEGLRKGKKVSLITDAEIRVMTTFSYFNYGIINGNVPPCAGMLE